MFAHSKAFTRSLIFVKRLRGVYPLRDSLGLTLALLKMSAYLEKNLFGANTLPYFAPALGSIQTVRHYECVK